LPAFLGRFEAAQAALEPLISDYPPAHLQAFAQSLGIETFVGSSGRVFPQDMKSAPMLRRWLQRLRAQGVRFFVRHRWLGFEQNTLQFAHGDAIIPVAARATVLALGGASWPQLGSDGRWVETLTAVGVPVTPLAPANCGFECAWSEFFKTHFAGEPLGSLFFRDPSARAPRISTGVDSGVRAHRGGIRRSADDRWESGRPDPRGIRAAVRICGVDAI
jgi:predicted flavoprotein YhiN